MDNKIFWKRDNRREEENSQFLVSLGKKKHWNQFVSPPFVISRL